MTNLSPQAQAVQDAVLALYADVVPRESAWAVDAEIVAAAIRAAVNQVIPDNALYARSCCEFVGELNRKQLLALADELEISATENQ